MEVQQQMIIYFDNALTWKKQAFKLPMKDTTVIASASCFACIVAIVFLILSHTCYEDSLLKNKYVCEIYDASTELCRYKCGENCYQERRRRLSFISSSQSIAPNTNTRHTPNDTVHVAEYYDSTNCHEHCVAKYCWGYEYVYSWTPVHLLSNRIQKQPLQIQTKSANPNGNHTNDGNIELWNQTVHWILNDLNTNYDIGDDDLDISMTNNDKLNRFVNEYNEIMHQVFFNLTVGIHRNMKDGSSYNYDYSYSDYNYNYNSNYSNSSNVTYNIVHDCSRDWIYPAYETSGSCSGWPIEWHYAGDTEHCWSNNKCHRWTRTSPQTNKVLYVIFEWFGIIALAVCVTFVLVYIGIKTKRRRYTRLY